MCFTKPRPPRERRAYLLSRSFVKLDGSVEALLDDFLIHLRHERGQSEQTQKTYASVLGRFVRWAKELGLHEWSQVEFRHLSGFLQAERTRRPAREPEDSARRLSIETLYLVIAALRALYRFAVAEG